MKDIKELDKGKHFMFMTRKTQNCCQDFNADQFLPHDLLL